jgi:hypothetical protein
MIRRVVKNQGKGTIRVISPQLEIMKKTVACLVGIALLACPLLASAQTETTSDNSTLVVLLEQLIATLTQELNALIRPPQGSSRSTPSVILMDSPTSGALPFKDILESPPNSELPSATINQNSLITTSNTSTITGTATGLSNISVEVENPLVENLGSLSGEVVTVHIPPCLRPSCGAATAVV